MLHKLLAANTLKSKLKASIILLALSSLSPVLLPLCGTELLADNNKLSSKSPTESSQGVKIEMLQIYNSFKELLKYTVDDSAFSDPSNDARIRELLLSMTTKFYDVSVVGHAAQNEPAFKATLKATSELLRDANNHFRAGQKGYALWRLRATQNNCMTCHTRSAVKYDFIDNSKPPSGLTKLGLAQFYTTTRQFSKSEELYLSYALDSNNEASRIDALQRWLVLAVRVHPDANYALSSLKKVVGLKNLSAHDREIVSEWIAALKRWSSEIPTKISVMERARVLVTGSYSSSLDSDRYDFIVSDQYTVDLLRASALLHSALDSTAMDPSSKPEALYLLGVIYKRLPALFTAELPESFLEQCIREFPGTDYAKQSYKLYREIIQLGYTGIGGSYIPDDVSLALKELEQLAYGVPKLQDRI